MQQQTLHTTKPYPVCGNPETTLLAYNDEENLGFVGGKYHDIHCSIRKTARQQQYRQAIFLVAIDTQLRPTYNLIFEIDNTLPKNALCHEHKIYVKILAQQNSGYFILCLQ